VYFEIYLLCLLANAQDMKLIKENIEIFIIALFTGIILPVFFFKNSFDPVLIPRTFALTVLTFVMLLVVGFQRYRKINYKFDSKQLSIFYILSGYFLISIVSSLFAINKIEAFGDVTKVGVIILFFLILVTILDFKIERIRILAISFLLMTGIFIAVGVYQFLFKVDLSGVAEHEDYLAYYYTTALNVVSSTLANKNLFSSALFLTMPFTIYAIVFLRKWLKIIPIITLAISLFAAIMLVAKAVWVAIGMSVLMGFVLLLIFVNKRIGLKNVHVLYKIGFISLIIIAATFLTFVYISENKIAIIVKEKITQLVDFENFKEENIIKAERTYSTQQRVMSYYRSFDMFKDNPILGVGPANWRINLPKYGLYGFGGEIEQGNRNFQRPHNDFLWVLCETGIFGFLLYISVFIYCIVLGIKTFMNHDSKEKRVLSILITSTLFGFFILSLFDFPKERITHNILVYSMFAIILNLDKNEESKYVKNSWIHLVFVVAIIFNLIAIKYQHARFKSEIAAVDVHRAYLQRNMKRIILETKKINHTFYSINPFSNPIEYYNGLAYSFMNKPDLALRSFSKAYNQAPYQIALISNYGTLLSMKGKVQEAEKLYYEAVEISPRFIDGNINLASVLHNKKSHEEAYNIILNIDYQKNNERYDNVLVNVLKNRLFLEYKKTNNKELRDKIVKLINNKNMLISFHKEVLKNDKDLIFVLGEL
jgi:O-antigen ligase/Tfp pilus assembly protein PilF